jgi:predicted phage terminase large subunit-like protein
MPAVKVLPIYEKQSHFRNSKAKVKAFIGGRGCVAPETRINGVPIAEIGTSTRLSTLFGNQESLPPFLKGKADLYRVCTESGLEVVVTDAHRFLTPAGWLPLIDLRYGSLIAIGDGSHESYSMETGRDWKDRYCLGSRLSDELPSPSATAFQETLQRFCSIRSDSSDCHRDRLSIAGCDAHTLYQLFSGHLVPPDVYGQFQLALSRLRQEIQQSVCRYNQTGTLQPCGAHQCRSQYDAHQFACRAFEQESRIASSEPIQPTCCNLEPLQSLMRLIHSLQVLGFDRQVLSCESWDSIKSIKWERKGEFWDLHVPVQNHYSAHGIWHHNTGKTFIGALDILMSAKRDQPWVCVSPDNNVIRETTFPMFSELAIRTGQFIREVKSPMPRITFRTLDGGIANIVFRSGEAPEKLRGGNYAGAWLDEATVMREEVYKLLRPTLRWRGKMGPTLITATPKGTKHWTFSKLYEPAEFVGNDGATATGVEFINGLPYRKRKNVDLIRASTRDNPFLPPDFYEENIQDYGTLLAQQEFEGDFIEIAGLMFRREWFQFVNRAPIDCVRVRYWDQAATPGSGCYTAGLLMAMDQWGLYYVEHVIRGQWGALERNRIIDQITEADSRKYSGEVLTFVEQEGGSGGKEIASQMISRLAGHAVFRDLVGGKKHRTINGEQLPGEAKVNRALGVAAQSEAGNIRLVRGQWNEDFLSEICAFPEYKFCDQVDAFSGAFNKLHQNRILDPGEVTSLRLSTDSEPQFGALVALQQTRRISRWAQYQESFDDTTE